MPLESSQRYPVMCLTQDGLPLSHVDQARRLCAAGARWIQLRMKGAAPNHWFATAEAVVAICRQHQTICIINDNVDIAIAASADGVHLGCEDPAWQEARERIGPRCLVGGTVNDRKGADRARAAGCLDYVGVGPLRFTPTKAKLAPVLGLEGLPPILKTLRGLPAWVIGGVEPTDLPVVQAVGAAGVAVSSALYRDGALEDNFRAFAAATRPGSAPPSF